VAITRYFEEQVLLRRTYLTVEMCRSVIEDSVRCQVQDDGRIRHWGRVRLPNEQQARILRVVTLADGETLHNAFLDRGYREEQL
jgi:hypothetical protein